MKTQGVLQRVLSLAALMLIALTGACATTQPQATGDKDAGKKTTAVDSPATVTGTWVTNSIVGANYISLYAANAKMVFRLKQDGESVKGTYDYLGVTYSSWDVPVEGTFNGKILALKTRENTYIDAEVVEGGQLRGTFRTFTGVSIIFWIGRQP